jgi:hypothetical protein
MNITPEVEKEAPEENQEKPRKALKDSDQPIDPVEFPIDVSCWGLNE